MRNALDRTSDESRAIVNELWVRLRRLGDRRQDRIHRRVGRYWIAIRSVRRGRVFAELRPHRTRIEVFILPPPRHLRDPHGLARQAPRSQGWGWFRARFHIDSRGLVPFAFDLIRQSYEDGRPSDGKSVRSQRRNPRRV
ncbi:MAG TPA: hypothetical protein VJ300_04980 [Thermoplasmata archaeon]|nr:hypothetical protein [Thermoplasmata archaeon]